jgi:hypothetical protein
MSNLEKLMAGLLVGGLAYAAMKSDGCDRFCQAIFGAAGAEAGRTAAAAAIGFLVAAR